MQTERENVWFGDGGAVGLSTNRTHLLIFLSLSFLHLLLVKNLSNFNEDCGKGTSTGPKALN